MQLVFSLALHVPRSLAYLGFIKGERPAPSERKREVSPKWETERGQPEVPAQRERERQRPAQRERERGRPARGEREARPKRGGTPNGKRGWVTVLSLVGSPHVLRAHTGAHRTCSARPVTRNRFGRHSAFNYGLIERNVRALRAGEYDRLPSAVVPRLPGACRTKHTKIR